MGVYRASECRTFTGRLVYTSFLRSVNHCPRYAPPIPFLSFQSCLLSLTNGMERGTNGMKGVCERDGTTDGNDNGNRQKIEILDTSDGNGNGNVILSNIF